ncbi:MAG: hypothetical protein R2684_01075 [Pyrinomonadaceae bacterium]
MNRHLAGILVFALTFGASFGLVGLIFGFPDFDVLEAPFEGMSARRNIVHVLERDVRNGDLRLRKESRLIDDFRYRTNSGGYPYDDPRYAGAISEYVRKINMIDVSHTPRDFQIVWNRHVQAWNDFDVSVSTFDANVESRKSRFNTSEINRTWRVVLNVARKYDVPIRGRYLR